MPAELKTRIIETIRVTGIKKGTFAKKIGVSGAVLSHMLNERRLLYKDDLTRIETAIKETK